MKYTIPQHNLAPFITKAASKQTYYTIRFLVDRERVADAYRAYAYFRWVDDTLDSGSDLAPSADDTPRHLRPGQVCPDRQCQGVTERVNFLARQKSLLEKCYKGELIQDATLEEQMLIEWVQRDHEKNSGLQSYLRNMMQVMEFDAKRRGRLISQAELNEYTHWLAAAVTEAMHYFIGHYSYSPHNETRYLAVTGAHIVHMLRDTFDDVQAGYYNIPREVLEDNHIQPYDIQNKAYRAWVRSRVQLAQKCFQTGRKYLAQVEEPRCRLAGFAYTARFEWLLNTIEQEHYFLRPEYTERKSLGTGLRMGLSTLSALINWRHAEPLQQPIVSQSLRKL
jgi:phytoene/squalene synthetase